MKISVLTLNCWAVFPPNHCLDRDIRLQEIAKHCSKGKYDVIQFQEIWLRSYYLTLRKIMSDVYPYSIQFHSGLFGSGLCTFSKYKIQDSIFFKYTLNGYPTALVAHDWYGGKGISLCKIEIAEGTICNFYNAHMHAEYIQKSKNDISYYVHQTLQAFELAHFIRVTSSPNTPCIVSGDFNTESHSLGYSLIVNCTLMTDAWVSLHCNASIEDSATCEKSSNKYTDPKRLAKNPNGQRIDYMLYSGDIECMKCNITMSKIANLGIPFSDHEGIEADFNIITDNIKNVTDKQTTNNDSIENIAKLRSMIREELQKTRYKFRQYILQIFIMISILLVLIYFSFSNCLIVIILFGIFYTTTNSICIIFEMNAYQLYINIMDNKIGTI